MKTIEQHLKHLVSVYPVSTNQANVKKALDYCLEQLESTGSFKDAQILDHGGVYSLCASTRGTKKPKILLLAHIDVVPAAEELRQLKVVGDKLVGRGAYDMLFATAIYLHFLSDIAELLPTLDIGVMLVGDEELGSQRSTKVFLENGYRPSVCILPDAGEGFGGMNISHRGVYSIDLKVSGVAYHASRPWEGDGAAAKLSIAISELLQSTDNLPNSPFTIAVTKLQACDSMNKAPAEAFAHLDIRYVDDTAAKQAKSALSKVIDKYNGQITETATAPAFHLDMDNGVVKDFIKVYKNHIDGELSFSHAQGASDARFFAANNIPVIMIRPKGGGAHGDNEWIDLAEIKKLNNLLKDYCVKHGHRMATGEDNE